MRDKQDVQFLLTAPQAAKALGISQRTLWTYTKSGGIPSLRIGNSVPYPIEGLNDWIRAKTSRSNDFQEIAQA